MTLALAPHVYRRERPQLLVYDRDQGVPCLLFPCIQGVEQSGDFARGRLGHPFTPRWRPSVYKSVTGGDIANHVRVEKTDGARVRLQLIGLGWVE